MESLGIITKLDKNTATLWLNSFLLVKKPDGSLRVCLDPTDLNKYTVHPVCNMCTLDEINHFWSAVRHEHWTQSRKAQINCKEVPYFGNVLSASGIKPDPAKVHVIKDWLVPQSMKKLQSFLGSINYMSRFISRLSWVERTIAATGKEKYWICLDGPPHQCI